MYSKKETKRTTQENETVCANCCRVYKSDDDWVQCDLCDKWFDKFCQNISDDAFQTLAEDNWYCKKCCN